MRRLLGIPFAVAGDVLYALALACDTAKVMATGADQQGLRR